MVVGEGDPGWLAMFLTLPRATDDEVVARRRVGEPISFLSF